MKVMQSKTGARYMDCHRKKNEWTITLGACVCKIPPFYPTRLRMYTSSCLNTLYNQGVICQISHISMLTIRYENKQMWYDCQWNNYPPKFIFKIQYYKLKKHYLLLSSRIDRWLVMHFFATVRSNQCSQTKLSFIFFAAMTSLNYIFFNQELSLLAYLLKKHVKN